MQVVYGPTSKSTKASHPLKDGVTRLYATRVHSAYVQVKKMYNDMFRTVGGCAKETLFV